MKKKAKKKAPVKQAEPVAVDHKAELDKDFQRRYAAMEQAMLAFLKEHNATLSARARLETLPNGMQAIVADAVLTLNTE